MENIFRDKSRTSSLIYFLDLLKTSGLADPLFFHAELVERLELNHPQIFEIFCTKRSYGGQNTPNSYELDYDFKYSSQLP